ncbi:hippurate hydrolase [Bosea sp. OK403]|uniref:amidohydrolase n=1 Tax=Bosea sp. OK403 TaxID=1855286 RepID=UPI0008F1744D|nr:amidohydrolase [Bosea sp. OK403]SFI87471.1 hippurate hydrolase [Bosea sp. OK403]
MLDSPVFPAIKAFEADLIAIRRDIHAHPEIAFEEVRTAALVARALRGWGIETHEGLAGTGVVGTLKGERGGQRAIALRSELDALRIEEKSEIPHRSTSPGKMHACGHDGHIAMLLGAARYLAEHRDFGGTVHFVFQPAEEGLGGACVMLEQGLFERFPVDAVYGMHNQPGRRAGEFGIRQGPMLAASDTWVVTFRGTGGHGGSGAHTATDPTIALANFILGVQAIVARNVPAVEPAVLSVGHINAGAFSSPNVIPAEVVVTGTARCFSASVRDILEQRLGVLAEGVAAIQGCSADYVYKRRYPPLINTAEETALAAAVASELVGAEKMEMQIPLNTGADDFAFMLEQRPGAFIRIGNGTAAEGKGNLLHTPLYDFNDDILALGSTYWVHLVHKELTSQA